MRQTFYSLAYVNEDALIEGRTSVGEIEEIRKDGKLFFFGILGINRGTLVNMVPVFIYTTTLAALIVVTVVALTKEKISDPFL